MESITIAEQDKQLLRVLRTTGSHWVGDGFPVRTLFFYSDLGTVLCPFLMLDYAGPREFPPTDARLGVGAHPHRGFETVTIVYEGEVEHRDSAGGGGRIGPGDVQWMTAASGLVHEEFHGREFARHGGMFEMVQLWVNLPAKDKMAPPNYQVITSDQIPVVELPGAAGVLRVIAGDYNGACGPARTFTPIHVWDLRLSGGKRFSPVIPAGFTALVVVLKGRVATNDSRIIGAAEVGVFDRQGEAINLTMLEDAVVLLLCGEPIDEPIVGHGPFVMNSTQEIYQAIDDYQNGRLGQLS